MLLQTPNLGGSPYTRQSDSNTEFENKVSKDEDEEAKKK